MAMSNDGHLVLYRVIVQSFAGPAYVANIATGQTVELATSDGSLATDGTLSGSGNAAFVVTTTGSIVRFDLTRPGSVPAIVVPATPFVQNLHPSPGTFTRLQGSLPPFPELAGHILLDGVPLPVLGVGLTASKPRSHGKPDRPPRSRLHSTSPAKRPSNRTSSRWFHQCPLHSNPLIPGRRALSGSRLSAGIGAVCSRRIQSPAKSSTPT